MIKVFFDVGANVGLYSEVNNICLPKDFGNEPDPENIKLLKNPSGKFTKFRNLQVCP